jgi:hypothetical protein
VQAYDLCYSGGRGSGETFVSKTKYKQKDSGHNSSVKALASMKPWVHSPVGLGAEISNNVKNKTLKKF